jgi:hypothetical protein|tara:strand:- start:4562 stop:4687 length:126 start_codon:yes stop_codon:yes gene_type:complete
LDTNGLIAAYHYIANKDLAGIEPGIGIQAIAKRVIFFHREI